MNSVVLTSLDSVMDIIRRIEPEVILVGQAKEYMIDPLIGATFADAEELATLRTRLTQAERFIARLDKLPRVNSLGNTFGRQWTYE